MKNLITEITELNGVIGARWLFEKIKEENKNAYFLDMGYEGSYSPRLTNNELTDYRGKEYGGPETLKELAEMGEVAFGTSCFEVGEVFFQVYHNTKIFVLESSEDGYVEQFRNAKSAASYITTNILNKVIPHHQLGADGIAMLGYE